MALGWHLVMLQVFRILAVGFESLVSMVRRTQTPASVGERDNVANVVFLIRLSHVLLWRRRPAVERELPQVCPCMLHASVEI